ncbi:MAG TPA: hypothetical protein VNU66_05355 [Mycobacteriales bacterium]|nr:hypothetical protein [Mycobacteriales bacterium]
MAHVPTATGTCRWEPGPDERVSFGWFSFGEPPVVPPVPPREDVRFWHAAPGRWRLELGGRLLAVADGARAAVVHRARVEAGGELVAPHAAPALLRPEEHVEEPAGDVVRDDLLGRVAWRWSQDGVVRWVDEQTGVLLRRESAAGTLALTSLEVGAPVDDALFALPAGTPAPPPPRSHAEPPEAADERRRTAGFAAPWWPQGCRAWADEGDPDVPEVLLSLETDGPPWWLGVAPAGHAVRTRGEVVRTWEGDGWSFSLGHPAGAPAEEVDAVVASVPRAWAP